MSLFDITLADWLGWVLCLFVAFAGCIAHYIKKRAKKQICIPIKEYYGGANCWNTAWSICALSGTITLALASGEFAPFQLATLTAMFTTGFALNSTLDKG